MRPHNYDISGWCCNHQDYCFDLSPDWANLEVTFTDGHKEVISEVRFQVTPDEPNPVKYVAGILSVETRDGLVWSLYGVRKSRFLVEGEE